MARAKNFYVCAQCGAEYRQWQGQCGACGEWNAIAEVRGSAPAAAAARRDTVRPPEVVRLAELSPEQTARLSSGFDEFDLVLGGGFVPGSVSLLGGSPGAGKSTLLLQTLAGLAAEHRVLYVSGEESLAQVALRAHRLGLDAGEVELLAETDVEGICATARQSEPKVIVIDSIQVMQLADLNSAPGSVAQVRESAAALTRFAKERELVMLLVGHVTKEGALAGPRVLEHLIDASLLLEVGADSRFRTLRGIKNRFGAVNELGIFSMTQRGLREVTNPSAIFLSRSEPIPSGSVVTATWEGTRPMLVEIQALVDSARAGYARRVAVGVDQTRLDMLLAVLHRHGGADLSDQDVFVNAVGGTRVQGTSADLAQLLAMVSSLRDRPLPARLLVFGELGLSGEIRPVPGGQERLQEAARQGFSQALVPAANLSGGKLPDMEVIGVTQLHEALAVVEERLVS